MKTHVQLTLIALFISILGFFVLFAVGSISGRGEVGFIAGCILYLFFGSFLARKHTSGWWYIGALLNIPIWTFFIFLADAGQFDLYFRGLLGLIISSYTGTFIGLWILKQKDKNRQNS